MYNNIVFMNIESQTNAAESGWQTETEEHRDQITRFLQAYLAAPREQRQGYDHSTELHFSGNNPTVTHKIAEGAGKIVHVDVFYEGGKPSQIHVVFDSENAGHNIDAYLSAGALSDYLGEEKKT